MVEKAQQTSPTAANDTQWQAVFEALSAKAARSLVPSVHGEIGSAMPAGAARPSANALGAWERGFGGQEFPRPIAATDWSPWGGKLAAIAGVNGSHARQRLPSCDEVLSSHINGRPPTQISLSTEALGMQQHQHIEYGGGDTRAAELATTYPELATKLDRTLSLLSDVGSILQDRQHKDLTNVALVSVQDLMSRLSRDLDI